MISIGLHFYVKLTPHIRTSHLTSSIECTLLTTTQAYAKAFGSYASLRNGYAYEALLDFTGAPYTSIRLRHDTFLSSNKII